MSPNTFREERRGSFSDGICLIFQLNFCNALSTMEAGIWWLLICLSPKKGMKRGIFILFCEHLLLRTRRNQSRCAFKRPCCSTFLQIISKAHIYKLYFSCKNFMTAQKLEKERTAKSIFQTHKRYFSKMIDEKKTVIIHQKTHLIGMHEHTRRVCRSLCATAVVLVYCFALESQLALLLPLPGL